MKVLINNKELFALSDIQKKVICNDVCSKEIDKDIERRLQWVIMHKYERCLHRLRKEWEPKLKAAGLISVPLDDEEFAALVFAQSDYKDRTLRDKEAELSLKK